MKKLVLLSSTMFLAACFATGKDYQPPKQPEHWSAAKTVSAETVNTEELKAWWEGFNDPVLNTLIEITMKDSPDRLIAEARVLEARGIRRSARSSLFPQINLSASGGRQDIDPADIDNFYEATFDASYELDIFGKNRKNVDAATAQIETLEASYQDVTLSLIAEVSRSYISYRAFQKQAAIAQKNLKIQEKTLELIRQQKEFGEAPQLDVERAENLVNTTRSSIPEFERLAETARLQLSVLTGNLPEDIRPFLEKEAPIPAASARPVIMAPANVIALRPDIRAASAALSANTSLAESVTAELFPTLSLSGFFGLTENALTNSVSIWNMAAGLAVSLLDFGRIEGRIDAARAVEEQAYQTYRRTVLQAVTDVETALTDAAKINEQRISLQKAFENAERALSLSEMLYREGEISFLDILDAQRTVNEADSALVTAEAAQSESIIRLYKALGVY